MSTSVDTLVDVIQRTVSRMFRLDARLVARRPEDSQHAPFDVSAIIGIAGNPKGSLVMSFPTRTARELTAQVLGVADSTVIHEEDVSDCVGEISNIVAGNLLPALGSDADGNRRISLPSVVVGQHRVVWGRRDTPCELLLFETGLGVFAVESNLRESVTA